MGTVLTEAWSVSDAAVAQRRLERLASGLEADHPGAAASAREGLAETLTLQRLGIEEALYRHLPGDSQHRNPVAAVWGDRHVEDGLAAAPKHPPDWQSGHRAS